MVSVGLPCNIKGGLSEMVTVRLPCNSQEGAFLGWSQLDSLVIAKEVGFVCGGAVLRLNPNRLSTRP
jgi:hypothetical protein